MFPWKQIKGKKDTDTDSTLFAAAACGKQKVIVWLSFRKVLQEHCIRVRYWRWGVGSHGHDAWDKHKGPDYSRRKEPHCVKACIDQREHLDDITEELFVCYKYCNHNFIICSMPNEKSLLTKPCKVKGYFFPKVFSYMIQRLVLVPFGPASPVVIQDLPPVQLIRRDLISW